MRTKPFLCLLVGIALIALGAHHDYIPALALGCLFAVLSVGVLRADAQSGKGA